MRQPRANSGVSMIVRTVIPILIGLAVTGWLFYDEIRDGDFLNFHFTTRMLAGFGLAWLFMLGRDFGLTWRFKTIAGKSLTWKRATRVDLMCAFTSAITPSAVGGSAFAIFYLNREGVALGRATTMTLTTLFLDEMFFVIFCPIVMLVLPHEMLFGNTATDSFTAGVEVVFWVVYAGIVVWASILFCGIILWPRPVARIIKRIFMLRLLRRWRRDAFDTADNMVHASIDLRKCTRGWWLNIFAATTVSWFSRYLIVNAIFWGFVPGSSAILVFGRQFVVWVLLMVSPTPGGSGVSEWLFTEYYGDLLSDSGLTLVMAVSWRIVSYYIYLLAGVILLPFYFSRNKKHKHHIPAND